MGQICCALGIGDTYICLRGSQVKVRARNTGRCILEYDMGVCILEYDIGV